jgi:hypothetical protein
LAHEMIIYNIIMNKSIRFSHLKVVNGENPREVLELVDFPIDMQRSDDMKSFTKHIE